MNDTPTVQRTAQSRTIRPLALSELPQLVPLARLFYAEGELPGTLRPEISRGEAKGVT